MKQGFLPVVLALATLAAVAGAGVNFAERARYVRPYDGIEWVEGPQGVFAQLILLDTPGKRAGIRAGDVLVSVNGAPVRESIDVTRQLFQAQPGAALTYELRRRGKPVTATVVAIPQSDPFSLRGFLELVGVLYLVIGGFVLFRRWQAPHAVHFYLLCLASFIVYTFSYSGSFSDFDWAVYWVDAGALVLQPALFLHFALSFPEPRRWFRGRRWLFALVYAPAALLLGTHVLAVGTHLVPPSVQALDDFTRIAFIHLAALFLTAAAVMEATYRRSRNPVLVQQMKWLTRGTWLAVIPFTAFYVVPLLVEEAPTDWMKISSLTLVFIPLGFGYAIIRYRLMDVDVIFRRGVAYTLATALVAVVYFGLAYVVAEFFHTSAVFGLSGAVIAIFFAAILFQPVKEWIGGRLDRWFFGERYDLRRTLEEFGRELSSEIHLDRLLAMLLERLGRTLPVERLAILLEDETQSGRFRLARSQGLFTDTLSLSFLGLPGSSSAQDYFFIESAPAAAQLPPAEREQLEEFGLHYFIPCRIQNRTIAFLALGKTTEGGFLTTEDIELVQTLGDYIAIALENARLYQSLEQKAGQIERLKDFSENILESTSVGLVALDPAGKIESWNSSMERLTGRERREALGQPLAGVFPDSLVREVAARQDDPRPSSLYKFPLPRSGGRRAVINIALAPLVSKEGQPIGRLLIFDDVTERLEFESQLMQAEKLTSIGLLAAGVAHEVNTPLAVISNYAQMLAKQLEPGDARGALAEKIVKQTFRASEIIASLLNFSRTGATEFGEVDLNRSITETLTLVEPQLRSGRIRVESRLADALPRIHGNSGKLQQVFLNLFLNARDAMPEGGSLRVRTSPQNGRVQVEVTDTGAGIARENLPKIYDPFFTTKSTGRGTGLGLAVTYGIIQEHGGTIQVSSSPGRGTSFRLEFPVREPTTAATAAASGSERNA